LSEFSCPYTSQQNGRAERKHRHILDSVRAMLISTSCPERAWGEAALTAVHIINRLPSSVLGNVSPFERLYLTTPNYNSQPTPDDVVQIVDHAPPTIELPERVRNPPPYLRDYYCYSTMLHYHEPQSYKEASADPRWQQAMQEEL